MKTRYHVIIAVLLYVLSIRYLSEATEILLSPFFSIYCLLTMVGALFPDVDWAVMKILRSFGHRNPITHSLLIPIFLFFLIHYFKLSHPDILAAYNAFTLGMASHLLGDLVKTGNLVWIPKRHENTWFVVNGLILIALLYLTGFFNGLYLVKTIYFKRPGHLYLTLFHYSSGEMNNEGHKRLIVTLCFSSCVF